LLAAVATVIFVRTQRPTRSSWWPAAAVLGYFGFV